jgi:hypothetical protein
MRKEKKNTQKRERNNAEEKKGVERGNTSANGREKDENKLGM